VREVVNELQVTDTSSIKDIAKDLAASATLRGKLIADSDISSLNFSIDVVNGIVYLSGVATSADEMNKVVGHAERLRFAQEVVNYIILAQDQRY
jgi:osmotically-inducible protein OsmY